MKKTSPLASSHVATRVKLLLVSSFAFCTATAGNLKVAASDGLVSINADDVVVQAVLEDLAEQVGLRLVQHSRVDRVVSISIHGRPLAEVLDKLLGNDESYQLFLPPPASADNGSTIPGTLWLLDRGVDQPLAIDFLETVLLWGAIGEKKEALRALRHSATPAAVQAIAFALGDSDERIRGAAIEALGTIGSDEALAALASASSSDDALERAAVTHAIADSGARSAHSYLGAALQDDDPRVRMAAADALEQLGADIDRSQIQAALSDPDPQVRERAIEILEDLDDEVMFRALFPQLQAQ